MSVKADFPILIGRTVQQGMIITFCISSALLTQVRDKTTFWRGKIRVPFHPVLLDEDDISLEELGQNLIVSSSDIIISTTWIHLAALFTAGY